MSATARLVWLCTGALSSAHALQFVYIGSDAGVVGMLYPRLPIRSHVSQ